MSFTRAMHRIIMEHIGLPAQNVEQTMKGFTTKMLDTYIVRVVSQIVVKAENKADAKEKAVAEIIDIDSVISAKVDTVMQSDYLED
jgi:6-phosphogluconate dehydrogenase